jgi:hypothetical protein
MERGDGVSHSGLEDSFPPANAVDQQGSYRLGLQALKALIWNPPSPTYKKSLTIQSDRDILTSIPFREEQG